MSHAARVIRRRTTGLLGALMAAMAISTAAAPAAHADDMRSKQWYLDAMKADQLWKVSTGKGITVAVIDSGVDASTPELRGKVLPGPDFLHGKGDARHDEDGHGTSMALTIAGSGTGGGVFGVAPDVKILPVVASDGVTIFGGREATAKGLRYAADHGARVINISLAGHTPGQDLTELQSAVDYAVQKGSLIFAGSGNDGDKGNPVEYPAATPGVVAVGAVGTDGKVTKFSGYGDHVALVGPGDKMPTRCSDGNGYCESGGTSHATAYASASAALIWSAHPNWTANQVLRVMMETAGHNGPVPSKYIGYGSIRPAQVLLEGKGNPGPPDVNPLLAARASASPTPETSPSPESTGASGNGQAQEPKAPEAAAGSDEGGFPLWAIAASAAAVVAVIGAAVAVSVRNRRA
ncbi:S8 family serine peptidase [Streptomyces sp. NPDC054841]